jgi:type IV secretory pathway TraG/TraD family ATPase VirD4
LTENVVSVLMQCAEVAGGIRNAEDDIWEKAMRQLLRNAIDLCRLAAEPVRMERIHQLALGGAVVEALLDQAEERDLASSDRKDLTAVRRYFLEEWKSMADRTKSGILMNLTAVCDPFLRGTLRELFCEGTTVTPDRAGEGKIIVIDLPVKAFNELGAFAAVIWKFLFQRAAERRENKGDQTRPLFIFADESQYFITSTDSIFQTTARSCRTATVLLTQSLPNYLAEMGGPRGKARIDSLLGNLQTKILHQNGDPETNQWAAELLTRTLQTRSSNSGSVAFRGGAQAGVSDQESWEYEVPPGRFLRLAKGGTDYRHVVTAILFQSGRQFSEGCHWTEVIFQQPPE